MRRPFYTLDVFTGERLSGNPLAVVLEAEDLDGERMQALAREFNLSETIFVLVPRSDRHRARVRIFTPVVEMPFAGHPLIGAASLLTLLDGSKGADANAFALEAPVGDISCIVTRHSEDSAMARFRLPRIPQAVQRQLAPEDLAAAFGLEARDVGHGRHYTTRYDAGAAYDCIPVQTLDALARARPHRPVFDRLFGPPAGLTLLYTSAAPDEGAHWRVRMFAPGFGVEEDPATGSAAAAFAGVIQQFEQLRDGKHDVVIRQGVEMGRPSLLSLQLSVVNGRLSHAELAGEAIIMSEGALRI